MIFRFRKRQYKLPASAILSILVFLASFTLKLTLEVALALNERFYYTKPGLWFNLAEYLLCTLPIPLSMFYFTY
jgi:hypothetical protein